MKSCNRCLLESVDNSPEIDSSGVCSYCRITDDSADITAKIGTQSDLLRERIDLFRGQGQYDCIAGFSGGKDSSYVIHSLKTRYGARVLAYTKDNGFLTQFAKDNINRLVAEFGVDHRWVRPKDEVLRAMYAKSLRGDCWPCTACFHLAEATVWKIAFEERIPFIVHGRTPEQIFRKPGADSFASPDSLIADNLAPYDPVRAKRLANRQLARFRRIRKWLLPDQSLWPLASENVYLSDDFPVPDDFAPELLGFFLYEEYNEAQIVDFLTRETGWTRPEKNVPVSHADCEVHDAAGYLYYRRYGRQFLSLEVASQIRHGEIDLEKGREILKQSLPEVLAYPGGSIRILSKASGIHPLILRAWPVWARFRDSSKRKIKRILGLHSE